MNKKRIGLIALIAFLVIGFVVLFVFLNNQQNEKATQKTLPTPTPVDMSPSSQTKQYKDAAGFEFSYPEDVTVETQENESTTDYSNLKLTSSSVNGDINISVRETASKTLEDYLKSIKVIPGERGMAPPTEETKLAEKDAMTVTVGQGERITYMVDEGILFIIHTTIPDKQDEPYWKAVHEKVISSFAFVTPEETTVESGGNSAPAPAADDEVEFEGEETIE
jgi:hypothetical protein